jgi:hypothetical protein
MLKVNLLPPEKRKLKRTPYYALVPLVVSVALLTGSMAAAAYFWLENQRLEGEIANAEQEVASLTPKKMEYESLVAQIQQESGRIRSIEQMTQRKVLWGDVMAAVVEVTSKNPRVWLDEVVYLDRGRAEAMDRKYNPQSSLKPPFGISARCNIAPDLIEDPKKPGSYKAVTNVDYMIKFRRDLKEHPKLRQIFPEFHPKIPEWADQADQDSKEAVKMSFEVILLAR